MTEIPEHLLERSRARRAAMGGSDEKPPAATETAASDSDSESAQSPAVRTPSLPRHLPADDVGQANEPPSPMAAAYQNRRKIPFWAMPVLVALPIWAYVFVGTLSPPAEGPGPAQLGAELFVEGSCAGCHGPTGGGSGAFPAFTNGAIYETWPNFEDHFRWVRLGSVGWAAEVGDTYGATSKPVGSGMPGFTEESLSDAELVYVILHERAALGGENPDPDDQARLEAVANVMFEDPTLSLDAALELAETTEAGEG